MKRKLMLTAVAIALAGMVSTANAYTGSNSNAVGLNTAQQKSAVIAASPNLGWYSSFSWYLKNNSNYTLTNIYVAHEASDAVNSHNIATLAPHASAGPFYGDWYSGSPDFWRLSFWADGYPFWNDSDDGYNTRKKCKR